MAGPEQSPPDDSGPKQFMVDARSLEFTTTPLDADTIYADGVKGVVVTPHVTKISFYEQVNNVVGGVSGRHVVTIVLPLDQFVAVVEHLNDVVQGIAAKESPEATT